MKPHFVDNSFQWKFVLTGFTLEGYHVPPKVKLLQLEVTDKYFCFVGDEDCVDGQRLSPSKSYMLMNPFLL